MKTKILLGTFALLTGSILTASAQQQMLLNSHPAKSSPADDITSAAQKLGNEASYSWHATMVVPAESRYKPGPTDGKIIKGGLIYVKISVRDNTMEIYAKGTNAVLTNPDGGWQTLADAESSGQGPARFIGGMVRNFKAPAAQAADLVADCQALTQTNDAWSGSLTEAGAKKVLPFRRNATVSNPSGTATFWVKNGELAKFEFHVKGTVTVNDNDMDIDRDTTVEISDAGTTTVTLPDDVKKLMP